MWTYVQGVITVSPMGRTQPEIRYILDTVLEHVPRVTGSEGDMDTYVIQKNGFNRSSSHNEFGEWSNLPRNHFRVFETQTEYMIIIDGALRDRCFDRTFKEFMKWICRLAKRVQVSDVLVRIESYDRSFTLNSGSAFSEMYETPSWTHIAEPEEMNWCEYLLWDRAKDSDFPLVLAHKYYEDADNDAEFNRRRQYCQS